ncbi:MAG: M23 family metallopeptidase [Fodinibius sp.]|nr:M23 family metallopeptidase [Fodinibius sp.]
MHRPAVRHRHRQDRHHLNPATTKNQQQDKQEQELPPMVERPPESTPAQLRFANPIPARDIMTSYFGDQRMHEGLDIDAEKGDDILSIAKGTVVKKGWSGRYGKRVISSSSRPVFDPFTSDLGSVWC